jgi:hypothetical protein
MRKMILSFILIFGSLAFAEGVDQSLIPQGVSQDPPLFYRCITKKAIHTELNQFNKEIVGGMDLEVGQTGIFNGDLVSIKPLEINDNGEVTGFQTTTGLDKPIHDKLGLIADLSIKTKIYLQINVTGENEGHPRGYLEAIWGTQEIFWRNQKSLFKFHIPTDCKRI